MPAAWRARFWPGRLLARRIDPSAQGQTVPQTKASVAHLPQPVTTWPPLTTRAEARLAGNNAASV